MITSIDELDFDKKYSYADYLTWRFDEYVELLRGRISRMAAPTRAHQRVTGRLHTLLDLLLENKSCQVFISPFDVRLLDHKKSTADKDVYTVVQPDVCVVCDISKLDDKGCLGSPDLIIEVLSSGTQKKDYTDKFELYAFNGVSEYWIVAPNDDLVSVYDLDDKSQYQFRKTYIRSEIVPSKVLEDFKCDLERVFSAKN